MAGQVESFIVIEPFFIASVKQGAGPASPRETPEVSTEVTHPLPISKSTSRPPVGTVTISRSVIPDLIMFNPRGIGTDESLKIAILEPLGISFASS